MTQKSIYRLFIYVLYTVFLLYILFKGTQLVHTLDQTGFFFDKSFLKLTILTILPIIIGVLFALPTFFSNFNNPGIWRMDGIKLFSMGIPTLLMAISPLLYASPIGKYLPTLGFIINPYSDIPAITCGTVFGYLFLSVFGKKSIY